MRRAILFLVVTPTVVLFALPAFAQGSPLPVTALSVSQITIALLGLLAGYVAQGAETGSILGLFTIPAAAIPYLSTIGTFLASLVQQLAAAAQSATGLTSTDVFNAVVLSLFMLIAPAAGSALRHHIDTPKLRARLKSNATTLPPPPPAIPPGAAAALSLSLMIVAMIVALFGCLQPPSTAQQEQNLEQELQCAIANWGQPIGVVATNCAGGALALAEDLVADIEALIAGGTPPAAAEASVLSTYYMQDPNVAAKVRAILANRAATRGAQ